jgi:Bacterial dnaA protein helix-turn-helix
MQGLRENTRWRSPLARASRAPRAVVITYAEHSCFQPRHLNALVRVQALVARVSDTWGNELRCHELARAIHVVVADRMLTVEDGLCGPVEHSWLRFSDGLILDAYVPGRLPSVQVVDSIVGAMYRAGSARTDICQLIVDRLIAEMGGKLSAPPTAQLTGVTVTAVIEAVARHFSLKSADLKNDRRPKPLASARAMAMYLARAHTKASYPDIARAFGGRHHTTVLIAVKKVTKQLRDDAALREQLAAIEQLLSR